MRFYLFVNLIITDDLINQFLTWVVVRQPELNLNTAL